MLDKRQNMGIFTQNAGVTGVTIAGFVIAGSMGLSAIEKKEEGSDEIKKEAPAPLAKPVPKAIPHVPERQESMPVFRGQPEDVEQRVNAALREVMQACIETGHFDHRKYLREKATWPSDIQKKIRVCCPHILNQEDVHFQVGIDSQSFDSTDGKVFSQASIQCAPPKILPRPGMIPQEYPEEKPKTRKQKNAQKQKPLPSQKSFTSKTANRSRNN